MLIPSNTKHPFTMAPAHGILIIPSIKRMVAPDPPPKNQPTSGLHETVQTKYVANYEDDSRCTHSPEVIPTLLLLRLVRSPLEMSGIDSEAHHSSNARSFRLIAFSSSLPWAVMAQISAGLLLGKRQRSSKRTHLSISFGPSQYQIPKQKNDPEHVSYMRFQQQTLWNDCACNPSSRVTSLRGSYDSNARARVCVIVCGKNQ